jgi:uncharacterized membrane protein YozB (DUF420 family)
MDTYLNPPGFLGTGASLLADVTLLAYVFLIVPAMVAGLYFARTNRHRPQHRNTMMTITLVNWVLILWLMVAALTFDVTGNLGSQPGNPRYIFPAVHAAIGLTAQVLATYAIYRMVREDAQVAAAKRRGETDLQRYWFTSAKPVMRVVLLLWFVAAALGILSYLFRYQVISLGAASGAEPVATEEAGGVAATEELPATGTPTETPAAVETSEVAAPTALPPTVPAPAETEEASAPVSRAAAVLHTAAGIPFS